MPEDLLRSALEKIVFFECRLEQLEAELRAARGTALRAHEEAAASRLREAELDQAMAKARAVESETRAKNSELVERVRLLESERDRFMGGLIEQARVAAAPAAGAEGDGGVDLAGFIAELRDEVERLKAWRDAAQAAGIRVDEGRGRSFAELSAHAAAPVQSIGRDYEVSGRIGGSDADAARMTSLFATRSERALYESSMRDLASRDPGERKRAAECLKALGSKAAAPLVAAALGREQDGDVKAALLLALGLLAEAGAEDLAARELKDSRPTVRLAALEAVHALGKEAAEAKVIGALGDPSALVRRRAALLLGFSRSEAAEEALVAALGDADPGVAKAAALSLGGHPNARAQGALAKAITHRDESVRRAAGKAVSRWAGAPVETGGTPEDRRKTSRDISDRLRALDSSVLRGALLSVPLPAPGPSHVVTSVPVPVPEVAPATALAPAPARSAAPAAAADPAIASAIVLEVRSALRGRTADDLARALGQDAVAIAAACAALTRTGALVARGPRFFMP